MIHRGPAAVRMLRPRTIAETTTEPVRAGCEGQLSDN